MVEVIGIHVDLASDEIGKSHLDDRVLAVMREIPRHLFVPAPLAAAAYSDGPLPIGFDKTISQPFMVALMTDLLGLEPKDRVLEIGTGLGYQTALLARLTAQVWSVEVVEEFAIAARTRLKALGLANVTIRVGDGSRGWVEHAPYDKILVAAGSRRPPPNLLEQLNEGGRLVMPLGGPEQQKLSVVEKDDRGVHIRELLEVRFSELETVV
ncbi:MAG: protein-L-isoaspartate(D-aspartate) O-methyltransferase [Xanthobacteraceae bacterium]